MAARLQSSEQLLRRELQQYSKDPSAGAAQGLSPIKVRGNCSAAYGYSLLCPAQCVI